MTELKEIFSWQFVIFYIYLVLALTVVFLILKFEKFRNFMYKVKSLLKGEFL
jgi:hypothetical protein